MRRDGKQAGRPTRQSADLLTCDTGHTHTDAYTHNEAEQQQRERHGDTADKGKEINAQLET